MDKKLKDQLSKIKLLICDIDGVLDRKSTRLMGFLQMVHSLKVPQEKNLDLLMRWTVLVL